MWVSMDEDLDSISLTPLGCTLIFIRQGDKPLPQHGSVSEAFAFCELASLANSCTNNDNVWRP